MLVNEVRFRSGVAPGFNEDVGKRTVPTTRAVRRRNPPAAAAAAAAAVPQSVLAMAGCCFAQRQCRRRAGSRLHQAALAKVAASQSESRQQLAVLIDGSFLLWFFQQYGTQPTPPSTGELAQMLLQEVVRLHDTFELADFFGVAFTAPESTSFRVAEIPGYRAVGAVCPQHPCPARLVMEACDELGIHNELVEGHEALDILAARAQVASQKGCNFTLVSGHKAALALVNPNVKVMHPLKKPLLLDEQAVMQRCGVTPALLADYYAMTGGLSNGLPGLPLVGLKRAAKVLNGHGSLEEVLWAADAGKLSGLGPETCKSVSEHADRARLARRALQRHPLEEVLSDLPSLRRQDLDLQRGAAWCTNQGWNNLATIGAPAVEKKLSVAVGP